MTVKPEQQKLKAALAMVAAVAETIRKVKTVPSGELYARLIGRLSLDEYNKLIGILKGAGLVEERSFELKWIGPEVR